MSASALHPDQFDNLQFIEPDRPELSVAIFKSLPDQPVFIHSPHGHRAQMQRPETFDQEPVWEQGQCQLLADMPQVEPYTGRPLTPRPGQIDVGGSQLEVPT